MRYQFDTKIEAEGALEEAQGESLGGCPLFKEDCHDLAYKKAYRMKVCVCYYRGDIHEPDTTQTQWRVYYPGCISPLISGEITADVSY